MDRRRLGLGNALLWWTWGGALRSMLREMRFFFETRRQVRMQMLRFADLRWHVASIFDDAITASADQAAFGEAQTIFGNLSDELIAFGESKSLATFVIRRLGMDAIAAGHRLGLIADEFGARNEDRAANYRIVARLLRFRI